MTRWHFCELYSAPFLAFDCALLQVSPGGIVTDGNGLNY